MNSRPFPGRQLLQNATAALACLIGVAVAQAQVWPGKPIRVINGNAPGGTQTVAGEAFAKVAGIKMTNVPYKGGGQAVGDLASGQVPVGVLGAAP